MRKKILYTTATIAIAAASFIIGRNTVSPEILTIPETRIVEVPTYDRMENLNLDNNADFDIACDFVGQIVDWNTDGTELAIMTKDGYELYAYKSEDVYSNRNFIAVKR